MYFIVKLGFCCVAGMLFVRTAWWSIEAYTEWTLGAYRLCAGASRIQLRWHSSEMCRDQCSNVQSEEIGDCSDYFIVFIWLYL